jgi:ribonuclease BN (tRNA processing enzyme)
MFKDERITVTAAENSHYSMQYKSAAAYRRDLSISYRIQTPDRVIVITGDTGKSDTLQALATDADILVSEVLDVEAIEAYVAKRSVAENWSDKQKQDTLRHHMQGHLPARDLGLMATAAKVKHVVLTHFVPTSPTSLDTSVVEGQVREAFDGVVVGGLDLQVF